MGFIDRTGHAVRLLTLALACALVTGCGYRLRGAVDLPAEVKQIYVNNASAPLLKEFKEALKVSGGRLAKKAEGADLVLNIVEEEFERTFISLTATGKASEFEYTYEIFYEWSTPAGQAVLPRQSYAVSRDYFNDQLDIIGKSNEESVLTRELYRQAAQGLLRQSGVALRHSRLDVE